VGVRELKRQLALRRQPGEVAVQASGSWRLARKKKSKTKGKGKKESKPAVVPEEKGKTSRWKRGEQQKKTRGRL